MRQTKQLTRTQIDMLHAQGFCVVRRIATKTDLKSIVAMMEMLYSRSQAARQADPSLLQLDMPVLEAPALAETQFHANASRIAQQVLGERCEWTGDQALWKPPGGRATPWHQDEAYWPEGFDYRAINLWLALDDVDKRNGCLQFKVGSHKLQILPHHVTATHDGFPELEVDRCPRASTVCCALEPGDATIHWSRTLHFAGRNLTGYNRRAYALGFGCPPTRKV